MMPGSIYDIKADQEIYGEYHFIITSIPRKYSFECCDIMYLYPESIFAHRNNCQHDPSYYIMVIE